MAILYSEISPSGISPDDFTTLSSSTTDINKQVIVYRQFPDFETNPSVIGGRVTGLPFSVVGNSDAIIRAYNNAGSIYAEQYIEGSGWAHNTLIATGLTGIRPILDLPLSGGFDLYLVKTTGYVWKYHSTNGSSWSGGTQWSSGGFDNTGNLEWIAFGGGNTSLDTMYGVVKTAFGTRNIIAMTTSTQYDPGIRYPFPFLGFDCQWLSVSPDDTSGDKSNTDIRHILLISSDTAPILKYKIIDGLPVATPQETGGLMSCIIRPGEPNRGMNSSPFYPVSLTDNMASQRRDTVHASSSSSIWGTATEHDTLWVASYGFNEDINSNDQSYGFPAIWYYCSRDGKHWSQDHMLPTDTIANVIDFSHGCTLVKHGYYLYAVTCEGIVRSPGCLEFNNPGTNDQLDITKSISQYSSSTGDMKQTNITVENEHGRLNGSLLLSQIALGIITKFGSADHLFQVSIQEIDQIQPDRERPNQAIQISARDYIARLTDRSEAADAIQWDSPVLGRDTYNDIGGVANSGLAHTSTIQGSFETSNSTLVVKSGYKESIEFYAIDKPNITNGQISSIFTLPNPATHTPGSDSTNNPTFAGVLFRAFDKDNFWAVRFNYWTGMIEVVEKKKGINYIWYAQAPSSYFLTRATTEFSVGLRVEFRGSRLRVWETTQITATGSIWSFSFEFIGHGVITPGDIIQLAGYTGQYASGYAITDSSSDSTSDTPIIASSNGFIPYLDGTAVIAHDNVHIGMGNNYTSSSKWHLGPMNGLSGTLLKLKIDPRSSLIVNHSGALHAYMLTTNGLYDIVDILDTSSSWVHRQVLTVSPIFSNIMGSIGLMPSSNYDGEVALAYYDASADADHATWLTNNGSTVLWDVVFASGPYHPGNGCGSDIDNYGSREILIGVRVGSFNATVFQVLNGAAPVALTSTASGTLIYAIQKPLLTFSGAPNSSVGGAECFLFVTAADHKLWKTSNGGATVVDITPPGGVSTFQGTPIFTVNSNIIAVQSDNGNIYTSLNAGLSWTLVAIPSGLIGTTLGYYPTPVDDSYALYGGGGSGMSYSPDFGVTSIDATGDWITSIGAISGYFTSVTPLYGE